MPGFVLSGPGATGSRFAARAPHLDTADQLLVGGDLHEVIGEIERVRAAARARKGWIMENYLLRRRCQASVAGS